MEEATGDPADEPPPLDDYSDEESDQESDEGKMLVSNRGS